MRIFQLLLAVTILLAAEPKPLPQLSPEKKYQLSQAMNRVLAADNKVYAMKEEMARQVKEAMETADKERSASNDLGLKLFKEIGCDGGGEFDKNQVVTKCEHAPPAPAAPLAK